MKKYFVLALALMAFAVAPVMADVALSGEYNYSAAWNTSDGKFVDGTDKLELDFKATLDDFNTFKMELEDDGKDYDSSAKGDILDEALTVNYAKVMTDWGKYFGFAESGFGMTTTAGMFDVETKETADFTEYNLEYGYAELGTANSIMAEFAIMDMVDVYYGQILDTYTQGDADGADRGYLMGAQASIDPVTAEVYYKMTGVDKGIGNVFGLEVAYSAEVSDGVVATAAGNVQMTKSNLEEMNTSYGLGLGAEAYGATVNLSFMGEFLGSDAKDGLDTLGYGDSLAFEVMGIEAAYDILEWLSVEGGFLMAFGDYAELMTSDETFLGAEFGITVKPGAVSYSLGYIVTSEDAAISFGDDTGDAAYAPLIADAAPANGGIYFVVDLDY